MRVWTVNGNTAALEFAGLSGVEWTWHDMHKMSWRYPGWKMIFMLENCSHTDSPFGRAGNRFLASKSLGIKTSILDSQHFGSKKLIPKAVGKVALFISIELTANQFFCTIHFNESLKKQLQALFYAFTYIFGCVMVCLLKCSNKCFSFCERILLMNYLSLTKVNEVCSQFDSVILYVSYHILISLWLGLVMHFCT